MRKKYPSQIRYDEKNPTVTFRVTKQEKGKIQKLSDISHKSVSQLVRFGLLKMNEDFSKIFEEEYLKGIKDGITLGHNQGISEGYANGKKDWAIWVVCWRCHKNMFLLPNSEEHRKILSRMQGDLSHRQCPMD